MQYVLINELGLIEGVFDRPIETTSGKVIKLDQELTASQLIGRRTGIMNPSEMKIAVICNWRTPCGISTYTQFLIEALRPKVSEIRIFSEIEDKADTSKDAEENVVRCWRRGESMLDTINQIKAWKPNFVILQHEFGIFPKATFFLKLLQGLENIPHAVVLHSVYGTHLDKTICTSAIKNIIVHSEEGKKALDNLGHTTSFVQVIPHGCVVFDDVKEHWNIFQTPYAIMQFGFGFFYKGVDRAIEAVGYLKNNDSKYKDIFYCYLCSESANATATHAEYHQYLEELIDKLDLHDNVAIIRKYHSEESINTYLRTAKLALFPYVTDPNNIVYGASGAIRIAMANNIPVIASESHMFDDLEGVIPRPNTSEALAKEIDKIFSSDSYKKKLIDKNQTYVRENDWNRTAEKYLEAVKNILTKDNFIELP
jgi:glycosyltransferase involved in cell wall biosynthesis